MFEPTIENAKAPTTRVSALICGILFLLFVMQAQGQNLYQMSYNNYDWSNLDLGTTGGSGVAAFTTTSDNGLHVFHCGAEGHVIQNYNVGGGWTAEDLTAETGGPTPGCQFAGFSQQNLQYVFYYSMPDYHIHELFYNNFGWSDSDLTATTGGPPVSPSDYPAPITALTSAATEHLHIYYPAANGHIFHYYTVKKTWFSEDITAKAGAPPSDALSLASSHVGQVQYVYYRTGEDIHELVYKGSDWKDKDLTALTNSPPVQLGGMTAMVIPGSKQLSVYVIAANAHVIQLASTNDKKWTSLDLTSQTGGPDADNTFTGIVAYATTPNNDIHVYYAATYDDVMQTYNGGGGWTTEDLSVETGGSDVEEYSGVVGFSIANEQYLYYLGQ